MCVVFVDIYVVPIR